jgi:hypothetical protein
VLLARSPEGPLYRVARKPDPWGFPDWSWAARDPSGAVTFGNRFDDPNGKYRVLYAASQPLACYVETLARFRPDMPLKEELKAIRGEDDFQPIGLVPDEWFATRLLGKATVVGRFAELYTAGWVSHLRSRLAPLCDQLGLGEFDLSALIQAKDRLISQTASDVVHDLAPYAGIYYSSRYGQNLENWAIFEYVSKIIPLEVRAVSKTDPELLEALEILRLDIPKHP